MAYIEDEDNKDEALQTSYSAAGASPTAGVAGGTGAAPTSPKGSSFVSLGQYSAGDSGGARDMVNRLIATPASQGRDAIASVDQDLSRFGYQVAPGGGQSPDLEQSYNYSPSGSIKRDGNTYTYQGPTNFNPSAGTQSLIQDAESGARALGSFEGRQAALQKANPGGRYTQGMSALDAGLSGQAGGDRFQTAADAFLPMFNTELGIRRNAASGMVRGQNQLAADMTTYANRPPAQAPEYSRPSAPPDPFLKDFFKDLQRKWKAIF